MVWSQDISLSMPVYSAMHHHKECVIITHCYSLFQKPHHLITCYHLKLLLEGSLR